MEGKEGDVRNRVYPLTYLSHIHQLPLWLSITTTYDNAIMQLHIRII